MGAQWPRDHGAMPLRDRRSVLPRPVMYTTDNAGTSLHKYNEWKNRLLGCQLENEPARISHMLTFAVKDISSDGGQIDGMKTREQSEEAMGPQCESGSRYTPQSASEKEALLTKTC